MKFCFSLFLLMLLFVPTGASAFDILSMTPNFGTHLARTEASLIVVFAASIDPQTLDDDSFAIAPLGHDQDISGVLSPASTYLENDTVVFTPDTLWPFGRRYRLTISNDLRSVTGETFDGVLPFNGIFVANIPQDYRWPNIDPLNPPSLTQTFNIASVYLGFNPFAPEDDADPWQVPGMNATEAWKYSTGSPEIIIAVIDTGLLNYSDGDFRKSIFINAGELPLPEVSGETCAEYDCNGDGRFDVDDYQHDTRIGSPGTRNAGQLIAVFSDGFDDDGNGFVDDISGWDFLRNVNEALGSNYLPLGIHGHWQVSVVVAGAEDGRGDYIGACPECLVLPIRISSGLFSEFGALSQAADYANLMGASVISHAGANFTWSRDMHQAFIDAYDAGAVSLGVTNDEMSFHHWMPYAGEDAMAVKSILPMSPVQFPSGVNGEDYAFTEAWCTGFGSHAMLSVPAGSVCTSEAVASSSGLFALLFAYARQRGIDLEADEAKQIMTMTAYDIEDRCYSVIHLARECQEGYDVHFGYGRPDMGRALAALGDPDFGLEPKIPPVVRITAPEWWTTFDPQSEPYLDVVGRISARTTPFHWSVQVAKGNEPLEEDFVEVDSGDSYEAIEGVITTIPLDDYFSVEWASRPVDGYFAFDVTLRVQAYYLTGEDEPVIGEMRKSISVHTDDSPDNGLMPGFPVYIGASGESSPLLYDLDGDADRRLEIVFGTGAGQLVVLKYDAPSGEYRDMEGFPLDLTGDSRPAHFGIFASVAVGDLFGDSTPEIVVATLNGRVYAIDPLAVPDGEWLLPGFPVAADEPDPSTVLGYGLGSGFMSSPVLADLDLDGVLEIVVGSLDQKVYVWKPAKAPGAAARLSGWPVLVRADEGLVAPEKVCAGNIIPNAIFGTPAIGILDPHHEDPQISEYPSVLVATNEECPHDGNLLTGRIYAIYHDGMEHTGGPFLPNWPEKPKHASNVLPYFNIIGGVSGSPAVYTRDSDTVIALGTTLWTPVILHYADDTIVMEDITNAASINAAGSPTLSAIAPDEEPLFLLPTVGVFQFTNEGVKLLKTMVVGHTLDNPYRKKFRGLFGDIPLMLNSVSADLDADGEREIISGAGDLLVHAHKGNGGEVEGWPKYTQKWTLASPAVGDVDADGKVEVVAHTREGYLYAWESVGDSCPNGELNSDWPRFHHDEHNSGYYGNDVLPPGRVTDLTAQDNGQGSVRITFTLPGDDWWCGKPQTVDIRYTADSVDLGDWNTFNAAMGIEYKPLDQSAGAEITMLLSGSMKSVALCARDDAGNVSRIGNVADVEPYMPPDDDTVDDDSSDDDVIDDDITDDDTDDDSQDDDAVDDDNSADDDIPPSDDDDDDNDNGCGC
ncbi:MAG TPA: S8 family serine peptidase [bacterium]|nr:S8 family serine peptidase [bacterium]